MIPLNEVSENQSDFTMNLNFQNIHSLRNELELIQQLSNSMFENFQSGGSKDEARELYYKLQEKILKIEKIFQVNNLSDLEREKISLEDNPILPLKDPFGEEAVEEITSVKFLKGILSSYLYNLV
jgi:hypothetical protein